MSEQKHLYVGLPQAESSAYETTIRAKKRRYYGEKIPWKPVLTGLFLSVVGSVFLPLGIVTIFSDYDKGVSYLALGSITAIPGYYAFGIFLLAFFGRPGYRYIHIPGQYQ